MKLNNKVKNAQSLPLNTIVIAMLVIIVLLVIIVSFTSSVSKSNDTLNQNSVNACTMNPVIATLGYTNVIPKKIDNALDDNNNYKSGKTIKCVSGFDEVTTIPRIKNKKDKSVTICCGTKK